MFSRLLDNQYFVSLLKKSSTIVFGIVTVAFLSRAMGPEIKGEYDTFINIVCILNVALNFGISTIYPNYVRKREEWTLSTFMGFSLLQLLLYLIVTAVCFAASSNATVFLVLLCLAFSVFTIQMNNISLVESYRLNAVANILSAVFNASLAGVLFVSQVSDVNAFLSLYCVKEMIVGFVAIIGLRHSFSWRMVSIKQMPRLLIVGFVPMLTNLLVMVNYRIDVIFLKFFDVPFGQIGLYTAGLALAEYAWIIPDIFKDVLINRTARKDDIHSVAFCVRAATTFMLISYVALIIGGRLFIELLYGASFSGAYGVTVVVFAGVFSMVYCKLLGTLYIAQGKWNFYCAVLAIGVALNVFANCLFIPRLGIYGAAATTVISYSVIGLSFLVTFKRAYSLKLGELVLLNSSDVKHLREVASSLRIMKG